MEFEGGQKYGYMSERESANVLFSALIFMLNDDRLPRKEKKENDQRTAFAKIKNNK